MRTTVDLDLALLQRLQVEALRRGLTVNDVLASALRRGLDATPATSSRYRLPSFHLGAPQPGVELDKAMDVASALEDDERRA